MAIQIAIDGYSSCGKSTLAKALGRRLKFLYIDSGAMYRAVTLFFIKAGIAPTNINRIVPLIPNIKIKFYQGRIFLMDEDVSEAIREPYVANMVSQFAQVKEIRDFLVSIQQELGKRKNIIMDGRDVGTAIFPNADLKIFMTADPMIRAQRRYNEYQNLKIGKLGESITMNEVLENIHDRDLQDTTREISPLIQAADAIVLDNSNMTEEQQLEYVLDILKSKGIFVGTYD